MIPFFGVDATVLEEGREMDLTVESTGCLVSVSFAG